ncbi:hypothetical protein KIPE111705_42760 [Kibdelosporangium persicum]|uniref:hypothetical protein n=1 Tax=Kibdelosporangium persicum TaxID=2698649 RepID=UPI001C2652DB|nr:hypothetical protein [Kibdelosporangium persicum]
MEHIRGSELPTEWPAGTLPAGTRVRIVRDPSWDGPWAREFYGVIDTTGAPEPVSESEWKYWVTFDEPEYDADGDGPFRKAQIWGRYVQAV